MILNRPTPPQAGNSPASGQATNAYNQSQRMYNQSPQSFDNAAARVRSRVQGQTTGNAQQIRDQFAGRGMSNSGLMQNQLQRNQQAGQGAYAQGLSDLENTFEQSRLRSAQGLNEVGQGFAAQAQNQASNQLQGQNIADQFALGAGGLSLQELLGNRGFDVQTAGQNIQKDLGEQSNFKDVLGTIMQFGNAGLQTLPAGWRNELMNYFTGKL